MKPLIFSMLLIPAATTWAQTLRQEADRTGVLVSTAVQPTQLSEIPYASTLAREFNMLEPENDLKWAALRPDQKTFDFTKADQMVGFARGPGHESPRPHPGLGMVESLMAGGTAFHSSATINLLLEHITRVVSRYRGQVIA